MSTRTAEAELQLQSQILEQVHDAVVATDLDGRILSWNLAAERLYGYSEEEARGLGIEILFHPEDRMSLDAHMRAAALASGSHDFVGRFVHRSGVALYAEVRLAVLRDHERNPIGIVSCSHDVTRRVEQESELQLQSRVLASMGEAVFLTDDEGVVRYANPAATQIFRAATRGLAGTPMRSLLADPDDPNVTATWEALSDRLASQREWACTLECVRRTGERFTAALAIGAIAANGADAWVWVLQDITERKLTEDALRHREQLFRSMAENAPVMVWTLDAEGNIEYANAAWRRHWGLSVREANGAKWRDFITRDTLPAFEAALTSAIEGRSAFEVEYRMLDQSGEERVLLSQGAPRVEGDSFSGFVGSTTDITEIRQAEAARRRLDRQGESAKRLESLGVLAGGIAHDFNNLLVSILGFAELANEDIDEDHPARPSVEQIQIAARRAGELTQQILTFSGRARPETITVNIGSLLLEMLQLLERNIAGRARLVVESGAPTPDIEGDPSQVRQVVMNLLINAADAVNSRDGEVRVRLFPTTIEEKAIGAVVTSVAPRPGRYVCIEVQDNGRGMDEETQRRIFEPFFSTKPGGRGLGLASILGIVRSHKGGIDVESRLGCGSTFRVYFPVAAVRVRSDESGDEHPPVTVARRRLRVLVIDDDPTVLQTMGKMLGRGGYEVREAGDRAQALEILSEAPERFDAIVFDLTMPGMGAEEALERIKALDDRIPVLLASGYSAESLQERLDVRFGYEFLQKPFRREDLCDAIERIVRRAERKRAVAAESA